MPTTPSRLNALIQKMTVYLRASATDDYIVPKFVAKAIGESEVSVVTALRLLEKRGITQQHFGVFCGKTSVPIGSFDDLGDVPEELHCEICDEDHTQSDRGCRVEVYYTVDRQRLNLLSNEAAA